MIQYNINDMFVMFTIASFLGFVFENIFCINWNGYIDNRNMTLPFIHGYGDAVTGIYMLLGIPSGSNIVMYFLCSFIIVCLSEIILGKTVEKICGFIWWNYDKFPLHITHYTSVPTSLGFASVITIFMKFCFVPVMDVIAILPLQIKFIFRIPMFVILTFDMFSSYTAMFKKRKHNNIWRIWVNKSKKDEEEFQYEYYLPHYNPFRRR